MNDSAPLTWLINTITNQVMAVAGSAASAIAGTVSPLAAVCFGIYIILICVNYMRGAETEPVIDFGLRIAAFAVVVGLGLNAANYTSTVLPIVTELGDDLAKAVSGGTASANALDQLAVLYVDILDKGYTQANAPVFPFNIGPLILYGIKAALILIGLVPFLVMAAICMIIAKVGSILVAAVGPLFFGFLLFPATRQYFSAWLNTALSYALIPLFVAVISLVSVNLSKQMLPPNASLDDMTLKKVFLASIGNLVLLFLLQQVSSLASSLSAGGINAGMPSSGALAQAAISGGRGAMKTATLGGRGLALGGRGIAASYRGTKSVVKTLSNLRNNIRKAG